MAENTSARWKGADYIPSIQSSLTRQHESTRDQTMYLGWKNASCRSGAGADSEAVEAEHGAEIRASLSFLGLKRDAGRVGHSVDRIE